MLHVLNIQDILIKLLDNYWIIKNVLDVNIDN